MAFLHLLLLCSFMFCCSMLVGALPLVFSFSHRHLRTLTTFGVGLLIGTAFIVIIPEGIHTLYTLPADATTGSAASTPHAAHTHSHTDGTVGLLDAEYWQRWWQGGQSSAADAPHSHSHSHSQHTMRARRLEQSDGGERRTTTAVELPAMVRIVAATPTLAGSADTAAHSTEQRQQTGGRSLLQHDSDHEAASAASPHAHGESECVYEPEGSGYIGASLALGFVVMLVVDRLSGGHSHGPPSPQSHSQPTRDDISQRLSPASNKRVAGVSRRTVPDSGTVSSDRDRTDEDDELDDVVQRTNIIHIAAANTRPAAAAASTSLGASQQLQESSREKELTAEEREKERERQRVEREKEREKAHGYAPYASGSLPSAADPSTALSSSVPSSNATIGILVHSFVDGIALGAISLSSDSSLEMVVFLAILLHKGPAALGLVSFLMYQGRSQLHIRTQLTMFSLAAPAAALLTYGLLASPLPSAASGLPSPSSPSALGLMLLFSGGTFLFTIAVHIMPTIRQTRAAPARSQSHSRSHAHGHAHSRGPSHHHLAAGSGTSSEHGEELPSDDRDSELGLLIVNHQQRSSSEQLSEEEETEPLEWRYVLVLISGILAPLLFSVGHSHAHG